MKLEVLIDKSNIQYEGNFDITTEDISNRARFNVDNLSDLDSKIKQYVEAYAGTDTPDYQELIVTEVNYEITNSEYLEFKFKVQADYNFTEINEPESSEYMGVTEWHDNISYEFNSVEIIEYDLIEISKVTRSDNKVSQPLEQALQDLLEENEHLYEDGLQELEVYVSGLYINGTLYVYEGEIV